ncbi:MAG: hypothetical protein ACJARY_001074 [Candidatus Azotimanducaceae bacterium]|jgi:hypothetical protein
MKTNRIHIIYLGIAISTVAFLALTFTVRVNAAAIAAPTIGITAAASYCL